jgi:hypothetical protein
MPKVLQTGSKHDIMFETLNLSMRLAGEQSNGDKNEEIPFDDFNVTEDKDILDSISKDKRKDKFIYVYTDSGISENKRNWSPVIMKSLADQVVSKLPVGYLGHIKPEDYGYVFPKPQIVWIGSCTKDLNDPDNKPNSGDETVRLWVKGYLLPTSTELEQWIKTKAVDSISVYGKIQYYMNNDIFEITDVDLKSIDISRKLGEGLNSKIVGLSGEMTEGSTIDDTYEDRRDYLSKKLRKYFDSINTLNYKDSNGMSRSMSTYVWIKNMRTNENSAIASVDYGDGNGKLYEVKYTPSKDNKDLIIDTVTEVAEKKTYEPVDKPIKVGEMNNINKEGNLTMDRNEVIAGLTMDDIKQHNPTLLTSIKDAVVQEIKADGKSKNLEEKAGEMDKIIEIVGEQDTVDTVQKVVAFGEKFIGEMSAILVGEEEETLTPDEIVEKTKETVSQNEEMNGTLNNISDIVKKGEDEDLEDAVQKVVDLNAINNNKTSVDAVQAKFTELSKDVDPTILDFVKDDFSSILNTKPEDISEEDWKENSIKFLNDNFANAVKKYKERLEKAGVKAKAVGEMNIYTGLGTVLGGEQSKDNSGEPVDPDVAEAKKLGY